MTDASTLDRHDILKSAVSLKIGTVHAGCSREPYFTEFRMMSDEAVYLQMNSMRYSYNRFPSKIVGHGYELISLLAEYQKQMCSMKHFRNTYNDECQTNLFTE